MVNTGDVFDRLFQDSGPLGSFATRIKVGFAIRLYGKDAYNDLRLINKIRNLFAHRLEAKDFNTPAIRDRADKFSLPAQYPITNEPAVYQLLTEGSSVEILWDFVTATMKQSFLGDDPLLEARSKFLRTVEIIAAFL